MTNEVQMQTIPEISELLNKIHNELKNPLNDNVLYSQIQRSQFDMENLKVHIIKYIEDIDTVYSASYEVQNNIYEHLKSLYQIIEHGLKSSDIRAFLNNAIYLIEHAPIHNPEYYLNNIPLKIEQSTEENFDQNLLTKYNELTNLYELSNSKINDVQLQLAHVIELEKNLESFLQTANTIKDDYQNTKKAFEKDMELKASVSYWQSQAEKYSTRYKLFGFIAFILAIVLLISLYEYIQVPFIYSIIDNNISKGIILDAEEKMNWNLITHFGFLIFLTSISIWIIKIIIKLFLSSYHLYIDAEERTVMIKTYLALTNEGKNFISENDKIIILNSLFRTTPFGIIKEDTTVSIIDIVNSLQNKKAS